MSRLDEKKRMLKEVGPNSWASSLNGGAQKQIPGAPTTNNGIL